MRFRRSISILSLAVLFAFLSITAATRAGAATSYAIAATNVTMPASGNGTSSFTVTGIPLTGSLIMSCQYSGPTTNAKIPYCGGGPVVAIPVDQGQTYSGTVTFYPFGSAMPLDRRQTSRNGSSTAIMSLAGALLFGFGFRHRFRGHHSALLFAVCAFAILPVISACGNGNGMTPGTYTYTITAGNEATSTSQPTQEVSTTIDVTVP